MLKKIFFLNILLLCLVFSQFVFAEKISVKTKIGFAPQKAIGIIFDQNKTEYKHETNLNEIATGETLVSFRVPDERPQGLFASALIIGTNGETAFASVKSLDYKQNSLESNLPTCEEEVEEDFSEQKGLLEALARVRIDRNDLQRMKLREYLTTDLVNEIISLEKKYGIQEDTLITANIPPEVLNLRLYRLINAIKAAE